MRTRLLGGLAAALVLLSTSGASAFEPAVTFRKGGWSGSAEGATGGQGSGGTLRE
jgi:hypothetical protein